MSFLFKAESLEIRNFVILGNRSISDSQVLAVLEKYQGVNILKANSEDISADLKKEFSIFNTVSITKYYPDTLNIRISEREPKLVIVGMSGAFLVDSHGKVLQNIFLDPNIILQEKVDIARGVGDINSEYLKEIYLSEFKTNNQLEGRSIIEQEDFINKYFKYEEITADQRNQKLKELGKIYKNEIQEIWKKHNTAVDISPYSNYLRVNVYDSTIFNDKEVINMSRLGITNEMFTLLKSRKIGINEIIWEGKILIRFNLQDGTEVIFSSERKDKEQFEDYLLVSNQLKRDGIKYCRIDVSSTNVSVNKC